MVRGSTPQACLTIHTENYIYGTARNPLRYDRSCGGSSGGDAGLIAARCVPIGIGTDVGGSLRFPAYFTGIYGMCPSTYRLSKRGLATARRIRFKAPSGL